jgi:large exoprotein involved in heme utilization and adhesion
LAKQSIQAEAGEFVVTVPGGLPPSPLDALIGDEPLRDWVTLEPPAREPAREPATIAPPAQDSAIAAAPIVEAQGWLVSEDSTVQLIAAAPVGVQAPKYDWPENE